MLLRRAALLKTEIVDCKSKRMDHGSMSSELLCVIITADWKRDAPAAAVSGVPLVVAGTEALSTGVVFCAKVMAGGGVTSTWVVSAGTRVWKMGSDQELS